MNALIFKRHAAPFPRFQVTDDSKHSGSATTQPAYSYRRIQQRRRCFPRSAEPTENSPRQKPPRSPGPMAKSTPISCETAQNPQGRDRNALDRPFARTRHKHVPGNGARNERRERPSNNEHNHHGNTHRRRNQPKPRHGRQPPRKRSSRTCRPIFRKRNSPTATTTTYAHTETAEQNGVTLTVGWNDAAAGEPTTFHLSATDPAPLFPWAANRIPPSPGPIRIVLAPPWYGSASRGYASRTRHRTPGVPDAVR